MPQLISPEEREREQIYYRLAALVPMDAARGLTQCDNPTLAWAELLMQVLARAGCTGSHPHYRTLAYIRRQALDYQRIGERWEDEKRSLSEQPISILPAREPRYEQQALELNAA